MFTIKIFFFDLANTKHFIRDPYLSCIAQSSIINRTSSYDLRKYLASDAELKKMHSTMSTRENFVNIFSCELLSKMIAFLVFFKFDTLYIIAICCISQKSFERIDTFT